jgi:glycosyltransferase involved in cell wall biosynthesis
MRRRLLLVIPSLSQGGAERQILELAKRLLGEFEVTLCTLHEDDHYDSSAHSGLRRIDLGLKKKGSMGAFRALLSLLREERPALVQSFMDQANLWARLAAPLAGHPRVITSVRGPWMRWRYLVLEGLLARTVGDAVIVNSQATADEMLDWARVPPERLRIVHNFVDFDTFHPPSEDERRAARARFGLEAEEVALLLSGRLSLQKHPLGLALALRRLRAQGALPPHVKILLAGRTRDRWYAKCVTPALRWAGVESHVRALGVVAPHEVPALYAASDVLLLPSLWEGLPNVALEAHACGLPIVVTDKANADGVVADGETGFVAPLEWRMRSYADALGRILTCSSAERRKMGRKGQERVHRLFDPARVLTELLDIYRAVLENRALPGEPPRHRKDLPGEGVRH